MIKQDILFRRRGLREYLQKREASLFLEIDSKEEKYILRVDPQDLKSYLTEKFQLEAPKVDESKINVDKSEEEVDVSQDRRILILDRNRHFMVKGLKISYHIPFTGNADLFNYQPSTFTTNPPVGAVRANELVVEVITLNHDTESVKREFEQNFNEIRRWLEWVDQEVSKLNSSLDSKIEQRIKSRKDKLVKDQTLVSDLGYPLKKREDSVNTFAAPEIKRKITIKPEITVSATKPEPALSLSEYDEIFKIISNMAVVMERSPKAFSTMGEESIRQHFLVQLNGHYEGQATGETFNYEGKTDILIRSNGKNIFIAECKFWQGKEKFVETIDQILRYLSWRDTKTAIIVFNKNKNLSNILKQIPEIAKSHVSYKKELDYNSETGFRFILSHKDDAERELYLTVLVFEVPQLS